MGLLELHILINNHHTSNQLSAACCIGVAFIERTYPRRTAHFSSGRYWRRSMYGFFFFVYGRIVLKALLFIAKLGLMPKRPVSLISPRTSMDHNPSADTPQADSWDDEDDDCMSILSFATPAYIRS